MKATLLLSGLALLLGCEKPPTNPPPPHVEDQASTKVAASNLAKQPTEGTADAAAELDPSSPGTTVTPETAFEHGDAGPARGDSGGHTRQASGGPGDALDADAKAVFKAAPGLKLKGNVALDEVAGGVKIEVDVDHAPPGVKGIHIHEVPDCSNIPGKSMGEHFAPDAKQHGLPGASGPHHLGDLGNLTVNEDGEGELKITVAGANLKEHDPHSLLARAVVIHEKNDEGGQPSGNSGKPIACAIIKPE